MSLYLESLKSLSTFKFKAHQQDSVEETSLR